MTDALTPDTAHVIVTTGHHTAAAFGNTGVEVVGTPALIGFLETAAGECGRPLLDPGEATVGTMINVRHRAAAPAGAVVEARASLLGREGRRLTFSVEVRWGERVLMTGTHERSIVDLARFLTRLSSCSSKQ